MKRPITVLGAGRPTNSPANSSAGMAYAVIPLVLGLPIMGFVLAALNHVSIEQFAPLIFIVTALGLAAVFFMAAESKRAEQRAKRNLTKNKEPKDQL